MGEEGIENQSNSRSIESDPIDPLILETFFQYKTVVCPLLSSYCHSYYIELFYNPKRRHGYTNGLSPVEFEKQYFNRLETVN